MKGRKSIAIGSIIIVIVIAFIVAFRFMEKTSYGLEQIGNLYDNISNFNVTYGEMTKDTEGDWETCYLKAIEYEIVSINKDDMTATVNLSIPQISGILSDTIDKVLSGNTDTNYDDLKANVEQELGEALRLKRVEISTFTLILPIEKVDGTYKISPTDEWNKLVVGNIEKLYLEYLRALIGGMTDESTPE